MGKYEVVMLFEICKELLMFEYDIGSFVAIILLLSNVFSKLIGRCMEVKGVLIISVLFVCNYTRVDRWFNIELLIAVAYGLLCPYLIKYLVWS